MAKADICMAIYEKDATECDRKPVLKNSDPTGVLISGELNCGGRMMKLQMAPTFTSFISCNPAATGSGVTATN